MCEDLQRPSALFLKKIYDNKVKTSDYPGVFSYAEKVMRYVAPGLYPAIVGSIPALRIYKI